MNTTETEPLFNLDCPNTVTEFIERYSTTKGRTLANLLGLTGAGCVKRANALSAYAWNKSTAMRCRLSGDIATAISYEDICDRIYSRMDKRDQW